MYDANVKADLFSTAIHTAGGLYLVDPIAPDDARLAGVLKKAAVAGVIVTNVNHSRAAAAFADRFSAPIYAHGAARGAIDSPAVVELATGADTLPGLSTILIEGAPAGETALYCPDQGGTLIIGDALINFGSHGFTFLPAKYCSNPRLMRKSLRKLLAYQFERMLFAHGTPIIANARARFAELLDAG